VLLAEDRPGETDTDARQDHGVEPVPTQQRPESLHVLKVLEPRPTRLVGEDDAKIVLEEDAESPPRPKTLRVDPPSVGVDEPRTGGTLMTTIERSTAGNSS